MRLIRSLVTFFSAFSLSVLASTEPGPNTYVEVRFDNGEIVWYNFGECYPYQLDNGKGATAVYAQWFKSTDCQAYSSYDCSGEKELNLPIPAGTPLVNALDFVQLIAQTGNSANCTELKLPKIL